MTIRTAIAQVLPALMFLVGTNCWAQAPKTKMATEIPASIQAPDKVETSIGTLEYFDGVPKGTTVKTVYDYLDRSRAVNVFINFDQTWRPGEIELVK